MNNNINTVDVLAEFYKHCLNVAGDVRPYNKNSPLWNGWTRCYITPYLVRGKVINEIHPIFRKLMGDDFCKFKNLLLYTLQDYIDFSSINYNNDDTNIRTQNLILNLGQMEENEIINMIETNKDKFLSKTDCNNENIIDENYNDKFK
jgi:hypothetical protein